MSTKKRNELDSFDEQGFMIRLLPYFSDLKGRKTTGLPEQYESVLKLHKDKESITFLADLQSGWKQDTKSFERFNLMERLPKEIITSLNPYVKIYKVLFLRHKKMPHQHIYKQKSYITFPVVSK